MRCQKLAICVPGLAGKCLWTVLRWLCQPSSVVMVVLEHCTLDLLMCLSVYRWLSLCCLFAAHFFLRCMECQCRLETRKVSVRLSVKRVICYITEERSVQIFIPYERSFSLVFWEEEWLVGVTPSTWNFGSTGPHFSEIADFQLAHSASPVAKKVQLTLIGSQLCAFQWA